MGRGPTRSTYTSARNKSSNFPDISGLIVTQKLRERMGPKAPIILLSGDRSMETLNSLPHVGATDFFSKPVNSSQLIERLRLGVAPA